MVTLYALKPRFQDILRPAVTWLTGAGMSANQVTSSAATGSLAVGVIVAWGARHEAVYLLVHLWMLLRMALNAVDGMLAREFGHPPSCATGSHWGGRRRPARVSHPSSTCAPNYLRPTTLPVLSSRCSTLFPPPHSS